MLKQILTHKVTALLLLSLLLMLPIKSVMDLNQERQFFRTQAINSIMTSSSGPQRLIGPILVQPYTQTLVEEVDGKTISRAQKVYRYVLPEKLDIQANMQVTTRKLSIYQAQVYTTRLTITGNLPTDSLSDESSSTMEAGQPYLSMALSDARGINSVPELILGEQRIPFAPGSWLDGDFAGIHAPLSTLPTADGTFRIELDLRGMDDLDIVPVGRDSKLQLAGNWPHPNFIGDFLPSDFKLNTQGFEAQWQTSWFATDMESRFKRLMDGSANTLPEFSVSLVQPVDHYQLNERAAKYALLFIGLTFISFFMFELLKGLRVHPIQYALVGMGLVVFYLVLLALTEHLGFAMAYLLASSASVVLNGFYLSHVLGGLRQGVSFAALLGLVYAVLFGLLQAEGNALLLGALLLFSVLALIMTLTRKLDWYELMNK
jgi:inner membrane protein